MFRGNELAQFRRAWQRHGDIYHVELGSRDLWVCSHPDQVRQVLVSDRDRWHRIDHFPDGRPFGLKLALGEGLLTTEGDGWQRRRRIINPVFHRRRVEGMFPTMVECGNRLLDRLGSAARQGKPIDLLSEMKRVTQEIIDRIMFSAAVVDDPDKIGKAVDETLRYVSRRSRALVNVPLSWPTPPARRFRSAILELDRAIYRSIDARRGEGEPGDDLLGMLLEARDSETGEGLSDTQIRNEVATVYGAGHETTANAVTWAWHELMQHPAVLERLQGELNQSGEPHSATDMERLPYTHMVFEETLRLRPPVPINGRYAIRDAALGEYPVAPNAFALLIVNNMHRHPEFWERPDDFYPDHFTAEAKDARHRYAWSPFGAGPHLCIGNNLAMLEGALLLALMARRFTFEPAVSLPRRPAVAVTMKPKGGLAVRVRERQPIGAY